MPSVTYLFEKSRGAALDRAYQPPVPFRQHLRVTRKKRPVAVRDCRNFYSGTVRSSPGKLQNISSASVSESDYDNESLRSIAGSSVYTLHQVCPITKRTRAKTPVFAVGQLEASRNHRSAAIDVAEELAKEYRALLPPRTETPFGRPEFRVFATLIEPVPSRTQRRGLRKIKAQRSLYRLGSPQKPSRDSTISDSETLVGSEPSSPLSDKPPCLKPEHSAGWEKRGNSPILLDSQDDHHSSSDSDVALSICMDLLRNKLAKSVSLQHPLEDGKRSSGLQILLMIEAYETVQRYVRQEIHYSRKTDASPDRGREVDRILSYWLQVLYSVYDYVQETGSGRAVGKDEPLFLSRPGLEAAVY